MIIWLLALKYFLPFGNDCHNCHTSDLHEKFIIKYFTYKRTYQLYKKFSSSSHLSQIGAEDGTSNSCVVEHSPCQGGTMAGAGTERWLPHMGVPEQACSVAWGSKGIEGIESLSIQF
jgi:hypothetical protein